MSQHQPKGQSKIIPALLVGASAYVLYGQTAPAFDGENWQFLPAIAVWLMAVAGISALAEIFQSVGGFIETKASNKPQGLHGSAGWITNRIQIWREHQWFGWHPYWGTLNGKPLFFKYESVALTIGPPGSSKSTAVATPMILSLRESKLVPDFKGSLAATLSKPLKDRGENVIVLDLGDCFSGQGGTAFYNPTSIVVDNLYEPGGLRKITDSAAGLTLKLILEKENASGENGYFRIGSRELLEFCLHIGAIIYGYLGTLSDALILLSDRKMLLKNALWVSDRLPMKQVSKNENDDSKNKSISYAEFPLEKNDWAALHSAEDVQNYKTYLASLGHEIADALSETDTKGMSSFLKGATQSLKRFNITSHTDKITSKNTFRFRDLKDKKEVTTVFMTADASRYEAQKEAHALIMSCALTELKRSPNTNVPVTFIADEATNYEIPELRDGFLSWGRGYGIKVHVLIQFISEFVRVYGEHAWKSLMNSSEIIQFLPGQSEPEVLELIETMLGTMSVMAESTNTADMFSGVHSRGFSETGKPLKTKDQVRRCKQTILFVRQLKPMLTDLPRVFAIEPFRKQIEPDPFHGGKRYLQRVKLRLNGRDGPLVFRIIKSIFQSMKKQEN